MLPTIPELSYYDNKIAFQFFGFLEVLVNTRLFQ
jgi:hypothetical protein